MRSDIISLANDSTVAIKIPYLLRTVHARTASSTAGLSQAPKQAAPLGPKSTHGANCNRPRRPRNHNATATHTAPALGPAEHNGAHKKKLQQIPGTLAEAGKHATVTVIIVLNPACRNAMGAHDAACT